MEYGTRNYIIKGGAGILNHIIKAKIDLAKSTLVELSNGAKELLKVLCFLKISVLSQNLQFLECLNGVYDG